VFPAGAERVYAWFAVTSPERYRQGVRFEWYHEGERIGRPFETSVTGGRKAGFRTWGTLSRVWPGRWRVELRTDAGQLISAQAFRVVPAPAQPPASLESGAAVPAP